MYGFKKILGQEDIIKHLQSAIKNNKVSHSYIIEGEKGIGKKLITNSFAKTLQCESNGIDCCNICPSCKMYESINHPDVKFINATKKSGLGVDDIREQINKDINIKPYKYPYKIYIIDDADTMTIQAQNALLKTIEDPPSYGIILLSTENSKKLLKTILSRCIIITLKPISKEKIESYLIEKIKIPDYQASIFSTFSRGNIGRAKELVYSSKFSIIREKVIDIIDIVIRNNEYEVFEAYKIFEEFKDENEIILELMVTWLRDLLVIKKINDKKYLIHGDKYKTILKQGQLLSYNRISELINNIEKVRTQLKVNVNYQLSIEMMLLGEGIS